MKKMNKRNLRDSIHEAIDRVEIAVTVAGIIYISIRTYAFMIGIDL